MAKVTLNPVLEGFRGKIGNLVFKRFQDGVIVGQAPNTEGREPTAGQLAQRERFRLAVLYGRTALADPNTKALYEASAKADGQQVFALTVSDFLHAPSVDEIDLNGYTGKAAESIHIRASDDFEVTGVAVRITDGNGTTLEQAAATQTIPGSSDWRYQTTTNVAPGQSVSIEVTATDRPGHKTTKVKAKV